MAGKAGPSGLPKLPVGHGWYTESVQRSLFHSLVLKRTLFSGTTRLQRVEIIDTDPFGKTLVLDDKTQSAAADEFIYHEALVHPAMIAHDSPQKNPSGLQEAHKRLQKPQEVPKTARRPPQK